MEMLGCVKRACPSAQRDCLSQGPDATASYCLQAGLATMLRKVLPSARMYL